MHCYLQKKQGGEDSFACRHFLPTTNHSVNVTLQSETLVGVDGEGCTSWRICSRLSKEQKWTEVNGSWMNMLL